VVAIRAAQLGLSVAIVEAHYWGGVCLNVGCIPSKALLRNTEIAHLLRADADTFGIEGATTMRYDAAFERSRQVAVERVRGLRFLLRKNNIDEYEGQGIFVDRHTMRIKTQDIDTQISFDAVIIATGATPRLLPGTSRGPRVRTYEEPIMSRELPSSIAIIGAGPVGIEFAYVLANYGVAVTVIESLQRVLLNEDVDVSKEIAKAYRNLGVTMLVGARIEGLTESADAVTLTYRGPGAAETVAGAPTLVVPDYAMMPRVTFCQPQVASFGLTEAQARADAARGSDITVAKFPFRANGKAHGYGDPTGFAKVIADRAHGELLGAHLVGADVAELLPELTLAQRWDLTVEELVRNVHTHPTLSEALQETFHGLTGKMINF
jgi:pyruvate/2-oxoglutarate dehydrogenase complex dihydrolipoamide dehydrogenase (E3) component